MDYDEISILRLALDMAAEDARAFFDGGLTKVQEVHQRNWSGPYSGDEYIRRAQTLVAKRKAERHAEGFRRIVGVEPGSGA